MKAWRVALQYIGVDGIREVQFASEDIVSAVDEIEALSIVLRRTQALRAKPGSLVTLVRPYE